MLRTVLIAARVVLIAIDDAGLHTTVGSMLGAGAQDLALSEQVLMLRAVLVAATIVLVALDGAGLCSTHMDMGGYLPVC